MVSCRKVTPKQHMGEHVKIRISLSQKAYWLPAKMEKKGMLKVQVIIILSHSIAFFRAFFWASPYQTGWCFQRQGCKTWSCFAPPGSLVMGNGPWLYTPCWGVAATIVIRFLRWLSAPSINFRWVRASKATWKLYEKHMFNAFKQLCKRPVVNQHGRTRGTYVHVECRI